MADSSPAAVETPAAMPLPAPAPRVRFRVELIPPRRVVGDPHQDACRSRDRDPS